MKPSFARTRDERDLKIREAQAMVGRRLQGVRYFDIDYDRPEHIDEGPRRITEPDAWHRPSWDHGHWHTVDYGAELAVLEDARPFSITWDTPGHFEGLGVHHEPFIPQVLTPTASAAVWDVTDTDLWAAHRGAVVEGVEPHYLSWDEDDTWWSPSLSLHLSSGTLVFVLARTSPDGVLEPSADDVTVLFSSDHLPAWLS